MIVCEGAIVGNGLTCFKLRILRLPRGASLLVMSSSVARLFRTHALSLTSIASKRNAAQLRLQSVQLPQSQ